MSLSLGLFLCNLFRRCWCWLATWKELLPFQFQSFPFLLNLFCLLGQGCYLCKLANLQLLGWLPWNCFPGLWHFCICCQCLLNGLQWLDWWHPSHLVCCCYSWLPLLIILHMGTHWVQLGGPTLGSNAFAHERFMAWQSHQLAGVAKMLSPDPSQFLLTSRFRSHHLMINCWPCILYHPILLGHG